MYAKKIPVIKKYDLKPKYYITTNGEVYRKRTNGELVPMKPYLKNGYVEYVLTKNDGSKQHVQAQILCIITYKGYPKDKRKTQVNHNDKVRTNNKYTNLSWMTPQENIKHRDK